MGVPKSVTINQLKFFGAAAATSGSVALCHICGITPEAKNLKEASGGAKPDEKISIGIRELNGVKEKLNTVGDKTPDIVALGCPHYSVEELKKVAFLIKGKRVKKNVKLWIFTSRLARIIANDMGIVNLIEKTGGKVIADACPLYFPVERWGFKTLMTDSAKMAYYAPGLLKMDVIFKNTKDCLRAAVSDG